MKPKLTVLIVTYNSSSFMPMLLEVLEMLTKNYFQVLVCDNNSKPQERKKIKSIVQKHENAQLFLRNNLPSQPSFQHGSSLDFLMKKVKTPYTAVLDHDAIFLRKNWDELLIKRLNDEVEPHGLKPAAAAPALRRTKPSEAHPPSPRLRRIPSSITAATDRTLGAARRRVKIIGTQAPTESKKYKDFPLMFAVLFQTKAFRQVHGTFMPVSPETGEDTGSQLRDLYHKKNFEGEILQYKNTRRWRKGPFSDILCAEYYLPADKQIFASHFMRGSIPHSKLHIKSPHVHPVLSRIFYTFMTPINRYLWIRDRRRWIDRCRSIAYKEYEKA